MEYKKILELIHEMNQTDLTKIEIEQDGFRVCLEKNSGNTPFIKEAGFTPVISNAGEINKENISPGEFQVEELIGEKVLSPMVGTFYTSSSPDNPSFVKVGDKVKKGQTLCIIEAMKLMNEIESEIDGEVIKILASNEQMVEFGQPLFIIR